MMAQKRDSLNVTILEVEIKGNTHFLRDSICLWPANWIDLQLQLENGRVGYLKQRKRGHLAEKTLQASLKVSAGQGHMESQDQIQSGDSPPKKNGLQT